MYKKIIATLLICALAFLFACTDDTPELQTPDNTLPVLDPDVADGPFQEPIPLPETIEPSMSDFEKYMAATKVLSVSPDEDGQIDMDIISEVTMIMDTPAGVTNETTEISGNIKMVVENGIPKFSMVMDMGDMLGTGSSALMEMQFDGINGYISVAGMETEMTADEYLNQMNSVIADAPEFPESAIKSTETRIVNGNEEITIIVDGNALVDYAMKTAGNDLAAYTDNMTMTMDDVKIVTVTKPDGTPVTMDIDMSMNINVTVPDVGVVFDMKMDMAMKYIVNAFGSGVEVDLSKIKDQPA